MFKSASMFVLTLMSIANLGVANGVELDRPVPPQVPNPPQTPGDVIKHQPGTEGAVTSTSPILRRKTSNPPIAVTGVRG